MKDLKYKFFIFSLFLGLISCNKMDNSELKKSLGVWNIERFPYSKGTLTIYDDHTYIFEEQSELSKTFSNGNWEVKSDTIIMSSNMPKKCICYEFPSLL